jgi:hypothetical protein
MAIAGALLGGILSVFCGLAVALFLRMACSLLGEVAPTFGRATFIGVISVVAQLGLLLVVASLRAWTLWPFLAVPTAAGIYSAMLGLRYARAFVVAITQVAIFAVGFFLMSQPYL